MNSRPEQQEQLIDTLDFGSFMEFLFNCSTPFDIFGIVWAVSAPCRPLGMSTATRKLRVMVIGEVLSAWPMRPGGWKRRCDP